MKTLRPASILCLILLLPQLLIAQKEKNRWYFGSGAGIDFNGGSAALKVDGAIGKISGYIEGCASIADPNTGALLFYSDGVRVWNRNHQIMPNGSDLIGHLSTTQSSLIVPVPGSSTEYYLFTSDAGSGLGVNQKGLHFSIVDMSRDGGNGDVSTKNVRVLSPVTEKLTAVTRCDGRGYWVICKSWHNNEYYAYPITALGVGVPVISRIGTVDNDPYTRGIGYLKASQNGRKLAAANFLPRTIDLMDFDYSTGKISNPITLTAPTNSAPYGVCFSPDNNWLYVANYNGEVSQYDVRLSSVAAIEGSKYPLSAPGYGGVGMQLGPDGRIYIARPDIAYLGVITNPNVAGFAAGFLPDGFSLGSTFSGWGLPNMIEGSVGVDQAVTAGPDDTICVGESIRLKASGAVSYRWSPASGLSCADCAEPMANPTVTTTYRLNAITTNGCTVVDQVTVVVRPLPVVDAGANVSICRGASTTLRATGAQSYSWSPATGLSCTDCPNPVATPAVTTVYTVVGTSRDGCTATDKVTVTVLEGEAVDAGVERSICLGDSVRLSATGGTTWRWSPADGLDCSDCRNPVARPTQTTLYTVTATSTGGCESTDTVRVTVHPMPVADAGADVAICVGGTAQLSASGGDIYSWSPSDGLDCSDCRNPVAQPTRTTIYTVSVRGAGGCESTDAITVTVHPQPVADAGPDVTICPGGTAELNGIGGNVYSWSPATGLSCADCATTIAAPTVTTTYYLLATDGNGCSALDSITVTVTTPDQADAGIAQSTCPGGSVQLNASNGAAWHWSPTVGLDCSDCQSPIATPSGTTLYTVRVTDANGCFDDDTVRVTVLPPPVIDAGIDRVICGGEAVQLGASGAVLYSWSPAEGLSCTDCANPIATPLSTTTYTVTGVTADGCSATDQVTVGISTAGSVSVGIDTIYQVFPDSSAVVPLMLEDPVAVPVDTVTFAIAYNGTIFRLSSVVTAGTLLDGWNQEIISESPGETRLRLIAPTPQPLPAGNLLGLNFTAFLGNTVSSALEFDLSFGHQPCLEIMTRAGRIEIDSICGLNMRLIDVGADKYSLAQNHPNPFNPETTIEFTLGLDGPTRLEIMNAAGERVALLVDEHLAAGRFQARWNASALPSGLYYYRLTSGDWSQVNRMVVVK